jgi:hypothetical protein
MVNEACSTRNISYSSGCACSSKVPMNLASFTSCPLSAAMIRGAQWSEKWLSLLLRRDGVHYKNLRSSAQGDSIACRSLPAAADQAHQNQDDRDDEQDVNELAHSSTGDQSQDPQNYEHDGDGVEHFDFLVLESGPHASFDV